MCLKRFTLITLCILFFSSPGIFGQETAELTAKELEDYKEQTLQLVKYLEGTVNFLGDPEQSPADKDIIINESYLKMFQSDETQVEDDLDPNREMALNKDVQAYLKDIVFFFRKVSFAFEVNNVEQLVNDKGQVCDSINNNQLRYMEVNLDPVQKDLKIASLYTTKPDRSAELKYWWENLSESWRKFFGDSIFFYQPRFPETTDAPTEFDTIAFWEILSFGDSSFVSSRWKEDLRLDTLVVHQGDTLPLQLLPDSTTLPESFTVDTTIHYLKVFDTIPVDMQIIYQHLRNFVSLKALNISGNRDLHDLKPVTELTDLVAIDFSNTTISDLTPLRNLNKLEMIHGSHSGIMTLEPLRFASRLRELDCSHAPLHEITVLGNLRNLNQLNIGYTQVKDIEALSQLDELNQLNLSGLDISDLSPLASLTKLSDLDLSATSVTDLSAVGKIENLQSLNISETYVTRLDPLKNLDMLSVLQANSSRISRLDPLTGKSSLKFIYCDNSGVNAAIAGQFMAANPGCLVIYNTSELEKWWNELPAVYNSIVREKMDIGDTITTEQLHEIIKQTSVDLSGRQDVRSVEPLRMMHRLESINLENTGVTEIEPLGSLNNLKMLNINGTGVNTLDPLQNLSNLHEIHCERTEIQDLLPLAGNTNLQSVYCDSTHVGQENVLQLREILPNCLVIYQSEALKDWWNGLSSDWQDVLMAQMDLDEFDGEHLQKLVNMTQVTVADQDGISDLAPLQKFLNLKKLTVSNTRVDDISPLRKLPYLEELNLPNNPIYSLAGIAEIKSLKMLNLENTPIEDFSDIGNLSWIKTLNIAGTKIKKLKGIEGLTNLENLFINNTTVRNLKGAEELDNLKEIKCYRTSISTKNIEKFKAEKPGVNVDYY
ncbi:MAG: hypothetical protein P8100_09210 [bacterium]